jgi:NADH-quinone oxidoreductase subunit N
MTPHQLYGLLPFMLLAVASIVVILLIAAKASHTVIQVAGFALMCLVILSMWYVKDRLPVEVPPLFIVDGFAQVFTGLVIVSVLVVGLLSYIYFEEREENPKEYYILLFLSTLGGAILTISSHFISFFLGLELLSVSLYALIAYLRTRNNAVEAGMKYLVLAALSSAFLLFGMALIFMETGTMQFAFIAQKMNAATTPLFITGIGMMTVAIGFKLALVPFHLWAADVYQGAPSPVTSFIATVSKIGVFAVLLRFAQAVHLEKSAITLGIFTTLAIISMIIGNILALRQKNIKRLLAYSSVAHFGYLLVAFLPGNTAGVQAAAFYLLAYSLTILAAFSVVTLLSTHDEDADSPEYYRGLFWQKPVLAVIFTIVMLSLAGIPLTAGFIGKFMVLTTGVEQRLWLPVIVLVVTSVFGLYYYLRIIALLFAEAEPMEPEEKSISPFFYNVSYLTVIVLVILLIGLGVFPGLAINGIKAFLSTTLTASAKAF